MEIAEKLMAKDTRLDREEPDDFGIINDICNLMSKMSMPNRAAGSGTLPHVLVDNLYANMTWTRSMYARQ